jgi:hypothetical protein
MQKNGLRDLLPCAFVSSLFVNMRLAVQTIKTGVALSGLTACAQIVERHVGKNLSRGRTRKRSGICFTLAA